MTDSGRPRVCLIGTHFAEYSFYLAREVARKADVMLVVNFENVTAELGSEYLREDHEGVKVHFMRKRKNPLGMLSESLKLLRKIRSFSPQVFHAQEDSKDSLAIALPFIGNAPLVLTMHDPKPHTGDDSRVRNRTRHGLYIRQIRQRATAVIVHGESLVDDVPRALGREGIPVFVIPHGPLGIDFLNETHVPRQPGRFLFFGRIEAYKGLEFFVEAIKRLRADGLPVTGVIAGRGTDLERHRQAIAASGGIEVLDRFLSPLEAAEQFMKCDAIVMPYLNATQSGVAAYAMGAGRPTIASDVGAISEMVKDGESGLLVPPRDVGALANAMREILSDRNLADALARGALERGRGELSWGAIATSTIQAYENVIHGRR